MELTDIEELCGITIQDIEDNRHLVKHDTFQRTVTLLDPNIGPALAGAIVSRTVPNPDMPYEYWGRNILKQPVYTY